MIFIMILQSWCHKLRMDMFSISFGNTTKNYSATINQKILTNHKMMMQTIKWSNNKTMNLRLMHVLINHGKESMILSEHSNVCINLKRPWLKKVMFGLKVHKKEEWIFMRMENGRLYAVNNGKRAIREL